MIAGTRDEMDEASGWSQGHNIERSVYRCWLLNAMWGSDCWNVGLGW